MGRVEYDQLRPGAATAGALNSILTEVATDSGLLSNANWAEEGLDKRPFASLIQARRAFIPIIHDATATQGPLAAAFVTFNPGVLFRTGAFVLAANETLRLRFTSEFPSGPVLFGITPTPPADVQVRLGGQISGIPFFNTASLRRYRNLNTGFGAHARCHTQIYLVGPTSFDFVEVQIADPGLSTVQIGGAVLAGMIYGGIV